MYIFQPKEDYKIPLGLDNLLMKGPKVVLLGLVQGLFGGSMYIFVFIWTPSLSSTIPYVILYFLMCAIGSFLYKKEGTSLVLALILGTMMFQIAYMRTETNAREFELVCGLYFPNVGSIKSKLVPERFSDDDCWIYNKCLVKN